MENAFRDMRSLAHLRQSDVAKALGVKQTTISMWETGKSLPRADMLPDIAQLYGWRASITMLKLMPDGSLRPRSIVWEDGTRYEIDRVVDVQRRASLKAGGLGLRYTVEMGRHTRYLWLEEDGGTLRWFVERK